MKRTFLSKLTALLLCCALLLTGFASALCVFARGDVTPVIVVSGMACFPLYSEGEDGEPAQIFAPGAKQIIGAVRDCIVPLGKNTLKRDFSDMSGIADAVNALFDCIACAPDGSSKYPVIIRQFPDSVDHYPDDFADSRKNDDEIGIVKGISDAVGAQNVYFFNYDWRLDPLEHADELDRFIKNVLREKDCDKVTLVPASMGGCVVMSYISKYGSEALQTVVMDETAFTGVSLVGELFNRRLELTAERLLEYFYTFYQTDGFLYQALFGILASCVDMTGVNGKATINAFLAKVLKVLEDPLYEDILTQNYANMPGIWALIPAEDYKQARQTLFPDGGDATLAARTEKYLQTVQKKAKKLIDGCVRDGVDFRFVASYGFVGFPASDKAYEQTDCLIDTYHESGFATCAARGAAFGEDYTPAGTVCRNSSHTHVSMDGLIDASSCMYPEKTWFIKYNRHVGQTYGTGANELVVWLATAEGDVDVYTDDRYEQFTALELFTGKLISLTGDGYASQPGDALSDIYSRLVTLLKGIAAYFRLLLSRLTGQNA